MARALLDCVRLPVRRDSFEGSAVLDCCGPDDLRLPCSQGGSASLSANGIFRGADEDRRVDERRKR